MKKAEIEKKYGLYLKLVVTVGNFDSYSSFYNIFEEYEEYVRRALILTPYKDIEEVEEIGREKKIDKYIEHQGNLWINVYNMLTSPEKIDIENIEIDENQIKEFIKNNEK